MYPWCPGTSQLFAEHIRADVSHACASQLEKTQEIMEVLPQSLSLLTCAKQLCLGKETIQG